MLPSGVIFFSTNLFPARGSSLAPRSLPSRSLLPLTPLFLMRAARQGCLHPLFPVAPLFALLGAGAIPALGPACALSRTCFFCSRPSTFIEIDRNHPSLLTGCAPLCGPVRRTAFVPTGFPGMDVPRYSAMSVAHTRQALQSIAVYPFTPFI